MDAGLLVVLAAIGSFLLVPLWLLGGLLFAVMAGVLYRHRRRDRRRAGSAGAQVEGGPEAGRPGAGGVGRH